MSQDTFCVNPWITLHYQSDGNYSPCCVFKGSYRSGSIQEYAQNQELSKLKESLLSNQRPHQCSNCWVDEDRGILSKRQRDNKTYELLWNVKYKKDPSKIDDSFSEYYLRLGNHCNLRCTICNDYCSSGWISEKKKYNITTLETWLIDQKDPIWDHMKKNSKYIRAIEFIGGEPFMMSHQEQCELLDHLIETGDCKHIRLKYNTNGTRRNQDIIDRWRHFRGVELNVSMDGIGNQFDYLRYPGKWNEFDANLKSYLSLARSQSNLEVSTVFTINVLNLGYVEEYLKYCEVNNINTFLNVLHAPVHLNIFKTSPKIKKWLIHRLKDLNHPTLQSIQKKLEDPDDDHSSIMVSILKDLDKRRDLSFEKTFPELVESLND